MALKTGFPPSGTLSPTVRIAENDQSFVPADQSFHRAGLIGFASKGQIGIPTLIASRRAMATEFGFPHPDVGDPYMWYAADQYLTVANELYIVRVADVDAVSNERAQLAEIDVPSAGGQIIIESDTAEPYSFATTGFFRWRLNGILASQTLVVFADDDREAPNTGLPYTALQLAEDLNLQLTTENGFEFFATSDDRISIRTTFAYGPDSTFELVSVKDAIYGGSIGGGNETGWGQAMTVASTTGSGDRYPDDAYASAGSWDFTGLTGLNIQVVVDGTDSVLIDSVSQVIDLSDLEGNVVTTADIVNEINAQIDSDAGGFEAFATGNNVSLRTLHHGRDARLLVKTDSSLIDILGFDGLTAQGTSPAGVSGSASIQNFGIVSGDTNTTGDITFTITADSAGIDGNATEVVIRNDLTEGTFQIEIFNNGASLENWAGLTKDQVSRFYVETFMSVVSKWIRIEDNVDNPAPPLNGTYSLAGGTDGIPSDPDDQDGLLIGNFLGYSGLYALSEPEQIDIDLIAIPGHPSTSVVLALIDFCENLRQDCMAIIDPPFGLTVTEVVQWQNGTHPLNSVRFDSDCAALYWPWLKQRDSFNRVDVWVPPSGTVMAVYARNDQLAAPWFAPAGETRGICPGVLDVFSRPTILERDAMYGNRNAVNPIIQFPDVEGFLVWGQKTLQRRPTALDRVNVRRMLFVCEKRIRRASRSLLFEPNDDTFQRKFIQIATGILQEIKVGRGLADFIIKADDELNTAEVVDRNEFRANIGIIPLKAVEYIFITFSLHRTGSFTENADTF